MSALVKNPLARRHNRRRRRPRPDWFHVLAVVAAFGVLAACAPSAPQTSPAQTSPAQTSPTELSTARIDPAGPEPTTESGGTLSESNDNTPDKAGEPLGLAAVVERVIDGDTILVSIDDQTETVRLLGIDTPEKAGGPRPAECFGAEASARLTQLIPSGTQVLLSRDRETRDQYGRLLAFVHRADTGAFVNLAMVQDGFATPLFFAPNRSAQSLFTSAGDDARRNWVGFWPTCGAADVVLPPD